MSPGRIHQRLSCLLLICCGLLFSPQILAHPYHTSLMEMEWNAEAQQWELALRFLPEDLEDALQLAAGKRVDLERTAGVDELMLEYIRQHLKLLPATAPAEDGAADTNTWQWVGKEVGYKAIWIYLTVKASAPPLRLGNSLLFERNPQQVNRVFLLHQGRRIPFEFSAQSESALQLVQVPQPAAQE